MAPVTKWMHMDSHQSTPSISHEPHHITDSCEFNKRMGDATIRQPRQLTSEQLSCAQVLANIKPNYQRPDENLIERMRKSSAASAPQEAECPRPSTVPASPTLACSQTYHFDGSQPVPQSSPLDLASIISQPTPNVELLPNHETWEHNANKSIIKKALSLEKTWDRKTWKQKSSNVERLKLLKDDGYDITSLQVKKTSADAIITALLAHVETRKGNGMGCASAAAVPVLSSTLNKEAAEPAQESNCDEHATTTAANQGKKTSDEQPETSAAILLSDVALENVVGTEHEEWHLYIQPQLAGIKRKHTHEDEFQPEWHELNPQRNLHEAYNKAKSRTFFDPPCTCCMHGKITRVMTRAETSTAFAEQAFAIPKRRIGRDIFQGARMTRRVSQTQGPTPFRPYITWSKPSRIILQPPSSPAHQPSESHVYVSANGMNLIMEELRHIASGCNEDGSLYITDPEEADDREGDRLMEAGNPRNESFRYQIRLSSTSVIPMVIEGQARALIGLLKHLREIGITHYHNWRYDPQRMEVIANNGIVGHLSDATQSALENLEMLLELGQALGGVEVCIGYLESLEINRSD